MSDPLQLLILQNARGLIANPKTWIKHDLARTAAGESCRPWDPMAIEFCAFGALLCAAYDASGDEAIAWHFAHLANAALLGSVGSADNIRIERTFEINDRKGRKAILALFDRALAAQSAGISLSRVDQRTRGN
jgi:hypothetical protein